MPGHNACNAMELCLCPLSTGRCLHFRPLDRVPQIQHSLLMPPTTTTTESSHPIPVLGIPAGSYIQRARHAHPIDHLPSALSGNLLSRRRIYLVLLRLLVHVNIDDAVRASLPTPPLLPRSPFLPTFSSALLDSQSHLHIPVGLRLSQFVSTRRLGISLQHQLEGSIESTSTVHLRGLSDDVLPAPAGSRRLQLSRAYRHSNCPRQALPHPSLPVDFSADIIVTDQSTGQLHGADARQ